MMPVFIFCWLFCVVLPRLSEGSTCSSGTVGFNPGTYYPQDMTDRMCRYQCLRYTNSSLTYVGITQSTVCFCLTNVGSAVSGCNASCSGNTSVVCGDFSGKLFNTYKMPCPAVVSAVINGTNANKASTVYVSVKCSNGLSDSGTMQLDYDTQYPLDTYVYNSTCPSNWSLNYAYHQPGTALIASLGTSSDGDYSKSGTVTQLRRFVGVLSSIPIKYLLINVTQTMQVYATVLSSATLNVLLGNGNAKNSILTDSTNLIVGQSGTATGQVDTSNVWLMPTLTVTKNYTLIDVRLQLAGAWSAAGSNILFIQVYRQACPVNQFYCTNSSSCVNTGSPCKSPNKQVSQSNCNSGSRYSLSAKNCINTSTNAALVNGGPPNSMTGNYYLQFDIPVNLTSATRLSTSTGEYFVSLADKDVIIQPNDVLAVYQPDSSSYVVATGSGQALTMQTSSITSWASRTGSAVTVQSYPSVTLPTGLTAQVAVAPLVKFTLASTVNVSVTFAYTNHSCAAAPVGCYAEDLYNMTIIVANSVSSANTSNTLHVQMPIGGLNFTQSSVCSTFVYCNFSVNPHIGSLPLYQVSFGDYQGNVTNMSYAIQTRAQHFYTLAGTYTTTLTGFNALTSQTVQQTVLLQDVIAGLQIYATQYPAGTIGQPVLFVVTVAQGSNATFSINFGDATAPATYTTGVTMTPSLPTYSSFFIPIRRADLRFTATVVNVGSGGIEACARMCLQSANDTFDCRYFAYDNTSNFCRLYNFNQLIVQLPSYSIAWQSSNSTTLYALQTSCSSSLLQTISYMANATSGSTTNITLNKAGWTATSPTNQSVMFAYSSLVQLNVLRVKSNNINSLSVWLSNDTFTWTLYNGAITVTASASVSSSIVLNPPVVTRFLRINVISSNGNPSANFDFSGCALQANTFIVLHTYTASKYNTTTNLSVTVNGSNLVSSASLLLAYTVDVPITNLSLICTSPSTFIYVNNTLSFRVSGNWGSYLELVITRQDGVAIVNRTYTTYSPFYDYNVTFWDPNLWYLTVTANNYVGQVAYAMPIALIVIQLIPAGCNVPYVDLQIPNACVPGKSCDPSYPKYNPTQITRSAALAVQSNTTNYCPRSAIFTWVVESCDSNTEKCVDYSANISKVYAKYYPSTPTVSLNGTQLFTLSFQPRVFAVGLYKFTLTVTIPGEPVKNATWQVSQTLSLSSFTYFSVVKSSLVACVNDFSDLITSPWGIGYNATLSAACSSDPDAWPDTPSGLTYSWSCYRSCESAPTFDTNSDFIQWNSNSGPTYNTYCPTNYTSMTYRILSPEGCFLPFALHKSGPLTPRTMDDWNCDNSGCVFKNQQFTPYAINNSVIVTSKQYWVYTTSSDNSIVKINTYATFYNTPLYFILTVAKPDDTRRSQKLVTLLLNSKLPPSLKLTCVINCFSKEDPSPTGGSFLVDPNASFKVVAQVLNYDPLEKYQYSWSVCNTSGTSQRAITYSELTSMMFNTSAYLLKNYSLNDHASTSYNSSGLSVDTNFPIFPTTIFDKLLVFMINVSIVDAVHPRSSVASLPFVVNSPPTVGNIIVTATPSVGTALNTQFTLYCTGGYSTSTPLKYSIGFTTNATTNLTDPNLTAQYQKGCSWLAVNQRVCAPQAPVQLPSGNATLNYTMFVCIAVTDSIGSTNYTFVPALQVFPVQVTSELLSSAANTSALQAAAINNPTGFQAYAFTLLSILNPNYYASASSAVACNGSSCPTTAAPTTIVPTTMSPETLQLKKTVVNTLINTMKLLPTATSTGTLQQYAQLAQFSTSNPNLLQADSNYAALNFASTLSSSLYSLASSASNAGQVESVAMSIYGCVSNVLTSMYANQLVNQSSYSAPQTTVNNSFLRSQSNAIDTTTYTVAAALLFLKVPGEKMTILNQNLGAKIVPTAELAGQSIVLNQSSCTQFQMGDSVNGLFSKFANETPSAVSLINTQSAMNQYLWLSNAANMSQTQVMSFVKDSGYYNVTNATGSKMFQIWLDTQLDPSAILPLNVNTTPYTLPITQTMLSHKVFVKKQSNLFINVQHYLNWTTVPVNVTVNGSVQTQYYAALQNNGSYNGSNIMFIIYVQKDRYPTDSNYLANCTVPNFDVEYLSCASQALNISNVANVSALYQTLYEQSNVNYYEKLAQAGNRCSRFSNSMMNPWTCMLTPDQIGNANDTTYYVGVRAIVWNWTLPIVNGTYNPNITSPKAPTVLNPGNPGSGNSAAWTYLEMNYTFFAYYSGCFYYDTVIDDFSTAGCTVGKCSSPYTTQCFCTHLTSFSNLFRLPSISFDITSLNINALNNSPGVMCFLVAVICAYFIIWIWARHADLEAEEKVGVVYLPDNDSRDQFAYEVTVWTGNMPGSGTSANVSLILAGDNHETDPRWLCDPDPSRKALRTGSVDMFLLTTTDWLGTLSHVRVWHDNTGKHPSWYLLRVLVRDIYTGTKYYFIVNTWLSAEKGYGNVDCLVPVAGKEELRGFKNVLWTRAPNNVFDGHLWLSVATRPTRSRFTRVQRLTCCLVMCLTSVLFNLLGYIVRFNANQVASASKTDPDPPIIVLGPITLTAYTLTISLISAACTIPVNLLIVLLFQQRGIREQQVKPANPYAHFRQPEPDSIEVSDQLEKLKEQEENEEADQNACATCRDRLSNCFSACVKKILPFGWWSHYVAYTMAFLVTVTAFLCSAILAYSNLPQAWQQEAWLSSIIISLLLSIFIIQPLQIFLIVMAFALIIRLPEDDQDEMSKEISLRRPLVEIPVEAEDAPRKPNMAKPPPLVAVTQTIRESRRREEELQSQIISFIFYLFAMILLFIVLYSFASPWRYNQYAKNMQMLAPPAPYQPGKALLTTADVWKYIALKFLPAIYSANSTNNVNGMSKYAIKTPNNYTPDGSSYLLGARLRQLRVANGSCSVPDFMTSLVPTCLGEYSFYSSDANNYLPGWLPTRTGFFTNVSSPFMYSGSTSAFGAAVQDASGGASGAGYVANLSSTLQASLNIVANLSASGWIDYRTRVVYIEFLAFNPSTFMYTVGYNELRLRPTGIKYMPHVYSLWLNRYDGVSGATCLISQVLALIGIVVFVAKTFISLCASGNKFWSDAWEVYDLVVSSFCILAIIVYIIQVASALYAESLIKRSPSQFSNLIMLCGLDTASLFLIGLIVFLMDIRLLKYIRVHSRTRMLLEAFVSASGAIFGMILQLMVTILAFTSCYFLICCSSLQEYALFSSAIDQLMSSFVYAFNFAFLFSEMANLGMGLFSIYAVSVIFILMRAFVPILTLSLHASRLKYRKVDEEQSDNPLSYLSWKLRQFFGCARSTDEDSRFEYITGAVDYEELYKNTTQKFEDLTRKVKKTLASETLQKAEAIEAESTGSLKFGGRNKIVLS